MGEDKLIWSDRKRPFLGLPWSFTRYYLYPNKLIVDKGFFSRTEDEIRLYRISDISLKRTFGQRLLGLGTIHCCSSDKTCPELDIKDIKGPKQVKEILSDLIEEERLAHKVGLREYADATDEDDHNQEHEG